MFGECFSLKKGSFTIEVTCLKENASFMTVLDGVVSICGESIILCDLICQVLIV